MGLPHVGLFGNYVVIGLKWMCFLTGWDHNIKTAQSSQGGHRGGPPVYQMCDLAWPTVLRICTIIDIRSRGNQWPRAGGCRNWRGLGRPWVWCWQCFVGWAVDQGRRWWQWDNVLVWVAYQLPMYWQHNSYFHIQKPWPRPSQAGAKPWLMALAWPGVLESQSCLRPGQSWGFQAKPGWNITRCCLGAGGDPDSSRILLCSCSLWHHLVDQRSDLLQHLHIWWRFFPDPGTDMMI